jgi:hypothetical protein
MCVWLCFVYVRTSHIIICEKTSEIKKDWFEIGCCHEKDKLSSMRTKHVGIEEKNIPFEGWLHIKFDKDGVEVYENNER